MISIKYLIHNKDGTYLTLAENNRWEFTEDLSLAAHMTETKAYNFLRNSISPAKRINCEVIAAATEECTIPKPSLSCDGENNAFDWNKISADQRILYSSLLEYKESLQLQLSQIDQEVCDIEHYIEFFSLDAAKGYKAYRMLREHLQRRRHIKDELAKTVFILSGNPQSFSSGDVERKIHRIDNAGYSPRVLSELFGTSAPDDRYYHNSQ